jgi:uncharacterized membrane protein
VTRCVVGRNREAEADRITAFLAVPFLLVLVAMVWPAAGSVIAWSVVVAVAVVVVVRRVRSACRVARRSQ